MLHEARISTSTIDGDLPSMLMGWFAFQNALCRERASLVSPSRDCQLRFMAAIASV